MTCFRMPNGMTLHKWCIKYGKCYQVIYRRLDKGMPLKKAIKYKRTKSHPKLFYKKKPLYLYCGGYATIKYRRVVNEYYTKNCTIAEAVKSVEKRYKDIDDLF